MEFFCPIDISGEESALENKAVLQPAFQLSEGCSVRFGMYSFPLPATISDLLGTAIAQGTADAWHAEGPGFHPQHIQVGYAKEKTLT